MSGKEELLFFREWATYLKRGELCCIEAVLKRSPSNPPELAFLLEIATQLCILKTFGATVCSELGRPAPFPLANFVELQSIKNIINADFIRKLLALTPSKQTISVGRQKYLGMTTVLKAVLSVILGQGREEQKSDKFQYLLSIGKCYYLLLNQSTLKNTTVLQEFKERWSVHQLIGPEWRENLVDLLILWSAAQTQMKFKSLIGQGKLKIEQHCETLMTEWFDGITYELAHSSILRHFQEKDLSQIVLEARSVAKTLRIKYHKDKRLLLLQMKKRIFSSLSNSSFLQAQRAVIFGCYFTIISTLCTELDEKIESIISLQDLLSNESTFYSCFWQLSQMDCQRYFTSFSAYMREYSQYPILQIYHKIHSSLDTPTTFNTLDYSACLQLIQLQKKSIFKQFNIQPVTLSRVILEHYLQRSGIPLPKIQKSYLSRHNRKTAINPLVPDPLHFMMIANRFWDDDYHRELLEIALWMVLHFYCKWLQTQSFREVPEKETQEYIKKLNFAVSIFCFSLGHPTRLLQYQPVESDCLKELFMQSIFPTLALNSPYFFKSYNWESEQIVPKTDGGLESWVLPWAHLLAIPKNMLHFIYLDKGYELAYFLATQNRIGFERTFGDFFVTRILTELQGLGIILANGQAQGKQKASFIPPERKKYMILLLKQSEKSGEKIAHTARRILQILS